jgi:hypothetical protein
MNVIAYGISVFIMLIGALFALQGLSLMPSRVMYGRPEWVVIGGAMVLAGAALIVFIRLRGARRNR